MTSLKDKTISGIFWSFVDVFANQGITFLIGIFLARLLTPEDFGLIGMIMIFIAVSESLVNSGFNSALIRKTDCTNNDYSTIFYFNIIIGLILFLLLYFSSSFIAAFFGKAELESIIKVFSIVIVIDSFSIIQRTILTKKINFKLQSKVSIIGSVFSGILSLILAYRGFGVWSLVFLRISNRFIITLLLWIKNDWKPILVFSIKSFKELFGFGSKLMISSLIDTLFKNFYYVLIGKFYSAQSLGFFTKSQEFASIPSQGITAIIGRVSYPILSSLQKDTSALKRNYKKLIRSAMLITFLLMMCLAAIAKPLVLSLIGEKWVDSIIYLQLLCFVGMLYPLHALNLNMLQVSGRSDLFLKLEIIKKILAIPILVIGVFFGVKIMIIGMILSSLVSFYINSYWSGKFINYSIFEQIRDIVPSFAFSLSIGVLVFLFGKIIDVSFLKTLVLQIIFAVIISIILAEFLRLKDYLFLKNIAREKLGIFFKMNGRLF